MKSKILLLLVLLSNILFSQTKEEIQKLEDFAKIYSVVRHFHPSDESAKLNWDLFTIFSVEEVLKTKNQVEFESKIQELFLPISPSMTFGNGNFNWQKDNAKEIYWMNSGLASGSISKSKTFRRKRSNEDSIKIRLINLPMPMDFYKLQLSNNFKVNIPLVVYEKNGETYPKGNLEKYAYLKAGTFNNRVAISNLIIMWSGLRHFFTYQDEIKIDWDKILQEGLIRSFNNESAEENFFTLSKFSHYFKDGHMSISYPKYARANAYSPEVKLKFLRKTNQLVIVDLKITDEKLKKGDVISLIDDKKVSEILDNLKENFSGSDQYITNKAVKQILFGKENSSVSLTLINGKKIELKRNILAFSSPDFFYKENTKEIEKLKDDVLYINLQNLTQNILKGNLDKIKSAKKIILDLRGYPRRGENCFQTLRETFFYDRNNVKFIASPKIQNPFFENVTYTDYNGWPIKKNQELDAKIVLLVYEGSASFQESIPTYLKGNDFVTVMGRATAGANGDRNDIALLNGMGYSYTGLKVRNPDGSLFHSIGIKPDIIIEENIEDIKNGKDTFIEKAIEYLNAK